MVWLAAVAAVPLALIVFWILLAAPERVEHHYLEAGQRGWVEVAYEVPGAPPLPEAEGVVSLRYREGSLETSSAPAEGLGLPHFYLGEGAEARRLRLGGWLSDWIAEGGAEDVAVWGLYDQRSVVTEPGGGERTLRKKGFFVGTRQAYEAAREALPPGLLPGSELPPLPELPPQGSSVD